jgi:hypothetical protein
MAVRRLSRSWPQKPSAAIFLHCSCLPRVISQAAVTRRNRRSCLLLRFRQPKFVQFASGRLHLAARLDDARLVDQCTHFCRRPRSGGAVPRPTDRLLGTAGAELAVKLAASLVRIRFVPFTVSRLHIADNNISVVIQVYASTPNQPRITVLP